MRRRASVLLLAAVSLAGCLATQPVEKPAVAVPAAWEARPDGAGVWPDTAWWQGFGSTELDGLVAAAAAGNDDLATAVLRIREAELQARIAGAALQPTLSGNAGVDRTWTKRTTTVAGRTTTASDLSGETSWSGGLAAGYQVDLFGANRAAVDAALARVTVSEYDRATVAITLTADVARTYFALRAARARIALAEQSLLASTSVLDLLEGQQRFGVVTELELSRQRSAVASQRAALAALQLTERQTRTALAVLLGRNPQGFDVAGRSLDGIVVPSIAAGLPSELLRRRPDLRSAEAALEAASHDLAAAHAARFPQFDLSLRASASGDTLGSVLTLESPVLALAGALTAPIFQGGRLEASEDLAANRGAQAGLAWRSAVLDAFRDVEDALAGTDAAARRLDFAITAQREAQTAWRLVEARWRAGTVSFLDVLAAQSTAIAADDTLADAALARLTALVDLYVALGGGWEFARE
ncbi:MAG: efflux transporter outer membrane subunit [Alphaproteobacteria bacterium]